ncbi:YbaY family lipoprotein [Gallaecimonas kandeliae]|uniref:YbaY family lipoprotein n=1 Tax=Gallaecimonas kandeliae TaxID=3029055 RepID=UPI0026491E71|nr:YbaY family lipoprotein [Gallaecimonas kandeliae]WKE63916.1 YbaY family lipoprotein [Gallaecimonas kandeliae]
MKSLRKPWLLLCLFLPLSALPGCSPQGDDESEATFEKAALTLKGMMSYKERIALPQGSKARVWMRDLDDPNSKPLAEDQVAVDGQVPIPFQLSMNPNSIQKGHHYGLSAEIRVPDGTLAFATPEEVTVEPFGISLIQLELVRVKPKP